MTRTPAQLQAAPPGRAPAAAPAEAPAPAYAHRPVLLEEVVGFVPAQPAVLVDATVGGGGHAEALLQRFAGAELFGCDRDAAAVAAARERLAPYGERVLLKHVPFSQLHHYVLLGTVDFVLVDLGVSSPQVDVAQRGFSFTREGPLDMRMDPERTRRTAADVVNHESPERLRRLLYEYGEERFAPRIVDAICAARRRAPIATTTQLADVVAQAVPARFHRKGFHPATRTFQALRIHVNDELGELERLLQHVPGVLRPGGRLAVIAFHSLEDRLVKNAFKRWAAPCTCPPELPACVCGRLPLGVPVTRKPVVPTAAEQRDNPRSRSAKLRVFERR